MQKILYILGLLQDADIDWLAAAGRPVLLEPGDALVRQGEKTQRLAIVLDGTVEVRFGNKALARRGAGEVIGEISMLDSRPPSATVIAVAPTNALLIDFSVLNAKLEQDHAFAARFYRALGVFLAQRMRNDLARLSTGMLTSGSASEQIDELDPTVHESITLSGDRFRTLIQRLSNPRLAMQR